MRACMHACVRLCVCMCVCMYRYRYVKARGCLHITSPVTLYLLFEAGSLTEPGTRRPRLSDSSTPPLSTGVSKASQCMWGFYMGPGDLTGILRLAQQALH